MYDSTVKSIGLDEIRVRYRQQRRALILKKLTGDSLNTYISAQTSQLVKEKDRQLFSEDVMDFHSTGSVVKNRFLHLKANSLS